MLFKSLYRNLNREAMQFDSDQPMSGMYEYARVQPYAAVPVQPPPWSPVSPSPAVARYWPSPAVPDGRLISLPYAAGNQDGNGIWQAQPGRGNNAPLQPTNARIIIELDGKVVSERQLNKPVLTVGRLSVNDVKVPSERVSRLHARIRWENGSWVIEDADSLNGLIYQGRRVDRLALTNGDRIYIAPTVVLEYRTT